MHRILSIGKTGLMTFQKKLDGISNNIANSQTDGYKKIVTEIESLNQYSAKNNGIPLSDRAAEGDFALGTGSMTSLARELMQGVLVKSDNPFSMAFEGNGLFGVNGKDGSLMLTRNGNFSLSEEGILVDDQGNPVSVDYIDAFEPGDRVEVSSTGEITAMRSNGTQKVVGKLRIFDVGSYEELNDLGKGYYTSETANEIDPEFANSIIRAGYVEKSNVDVGEELVQMIATQRAYSLNTKSLKAADDMWSIVNNMRR